MRMLIVAVLSVGLVATAAAQQGVQPGPAQSTVVEATPTLETENPPPAAELAPLPALELRSLAPVEASAAVKGEAGQDPFRRGSFWWYVAIVVVAGVILAVIT